MTGYVGVLAAFMQKPTWIVECYDPEFYRVNEWSQVQNPIV